MDNVGTNVNRGGYEEAYAAEDIIIETREKLCKLFHFDKLRNVIFTPSITYSLNYIIKGYLRPGDHVLVSSMEHNACLLYTSGVTVGARQCYRLWKNKVSCHCPQEWNGCSILQKILKDF